MIYRVGYRVGKFGDEACEHCGNERLKHLHQILFEDGSRLWVGYVCAGKLCPDQLADIRDAEKKMAKESADIKLRHALAAGWRKKGRNKFVSHAGDLEVTVFWDYGEGWKTSLPRSPHFGTKISDSALAKRWAEENI